MGAAPPGSTIRFASWNIRGYNVVNALIAAHERGVGVRVVMDRKNAYYANVNKAVNLLQGELKRYGNRKRPAELQSGLKKCQASCRGTTGFGHSKFFVFSKAGKARQVVINSSANATDLSTSNQWNDAFTMVGDTTMYDTFAAVFDEMYRRRARSHQPYVTADSRVQATRSSTPTAGPAPPTATRSCSELDRVACTGATNSQRRPHPHRDLDDLVVRRPRASTSPRQIRDLDAQGCRIKIVYAVAGGEVVRSCAAPASRCATSSRTSTATASTTATCTRR